MVAPVWGSQSRMESTDPSPPKPRYCSRAAAQTFERGKKGPGAAPRSPAREKCQVLHPEQCSWLGTNGPSSELGVSQQQPPPVTPRAATTPQRSAPARPQPDPAPSVMPPGAGSRVGSSKRITQFPHQILPSTPAKQIKTQAVVPEQQAQQPPSGKCSSCPSWRR